MVAGILAAVEEDLSRREDTLCLCRTAVGDQDDPDPGETLQETRPPRFPEHESRRGERVAIGRAFRQHRGAASPARGDAGPRVQDMAEPLAVYPEKLLVIAARGQCSVPQGPR